MAHNYRLGGGDKKKRESLEREKGLSCARRLSGHLIVL